MIYVYMYDNSDYVWWPKQSWPQMSMATATQPGLSPILAEAQRRGDEGGGF